MKEQKPQKSFKNGLQASHLARKIAQSFNRGLAIEGKIETVLNQLREHTGIKSLSKLDMEHIQAYIDTLADKVEAKELMNSTVATYISALNDIIRYTQEHSLTKYEVNTVSAEQYGLNRGSYDYKNRAVDFQTHQNFKEYLQSRDDIQAKALTYSVELQRQFGLRLRESIQIQKSTIEQAIKTGTLHLTKADGTKSGRTRDIPIRTEQQITTLKKALNFMKERDLKSLAPVEHIKEQYKYAENIKSVFNKEHNGKMDYHGERHFYAQQRIQEGASRLEVSEELGHSREEITKVYTGA